MVSFSCENCGDILKKPKLDQHAGRCRGAYFTCIDCNTTFEGTSYRAHTSCVSEEQRYHKSVYKAPKGKGKNAQQQQPGQAKEGNPNTTPLAEKPAPAVPEAAPAAEKKRAREDEALVQAEKGIETEAVTEEKKEDEPKAKKSKKEKKDKKAKKEGATDAPAATEEKKESEKETLAAFLTSVVPPLLSPSDGVSLSQLKESVLAAVKEKGRTEGADEVEKALWEGLKVGGKKQRVKVEFE